MKPRPILLTAVMFMVLVALGSSYLAFADHHSTIKGWKKGIGWGWIWGKDDEVGSLNAMSDASTLAAVSLVKKGQVRDLGITYSRNSFIWPGHSPGEIITFRTPEGVMRQGDHAFTDPNVNTSRTSWHSCALFMNDNVATQIDGLAHIAIGKNPYWYNGFKEQQWGGDWGPRKCDATTIPPIVARGVMLDIAALKGVDALAAGYAITPADVDAAAKKQNVELRPGDVVLFRTGTLRYWGKDGADHEKIKQHDTAGINLDTAKHLVENFGSMLIGSDTSGCEVGPAPEGSPSFIPVHVYLLIEQGVHIGEYHYLEDLARDKVYEFCYVAMTNKIAGTTAGFTMRPIAMY